MKPTALLVLCFVFTANFCKGQNLVPNPSFEDTVWCPGNGIILPTKNWYVLQETPDYYHECSEFSALSVPSNMFGLQWPSSGVAYAGMCVYTTTDTLFREAIGVELITPLAIGEKYYVNFKVCMAYNPNKGANAATNKLGALFTVDSYESTHPPLKNFCHIYSQNIIEDTTLWTDIRGSFMADSAYRFLSITNFFQNSNIDTTIFYSNSWYYSYYYIDDVCVSSDSMYCEMWTTTPEAILLGNNIEVYPNPAWKDVTIDNLPYDCKSIQVFNTDGKLVTSIQKIDKHRAFIDLSFFPEGIYSLIINTEKSTQIKKIVKSTH